MASRPILSFYSPDSREVAEWSATAHKVMHRVAAALEERGFTIDFEFGRHMPDWMFLVYRGDSAFVVALAIFGTTPPPPCKWFIGLVDRIHCDQPVESDIQAEVHPLLEAVVGASPRVFGLRWHPDGSTLREI